jgi:hypothetical protein
LVVVADQNAGLIILFGCVVVADERVKDDIPNTNPVPVQQLAVWSPNAGF